MDLVDRASLKYPSRCVVDCVCILSEILSRLITGILWTKNLFGTCRTYLVQLSMKMVTDKYSDLWNDWCQCNVWNWDVLKKLS